MKKLSKRLLAMLLVAVMVVAAIPFGAFAEGETHTGHDDAPDWVKVSSDATTHTVKCRKCTSGSEATKTEPHTWVSGTCSVCGDACSHSWSIEAGSGTASGHTFVCGNCGLEVTDIHRTVSGEAESWTEIPAVAATCTEKGYGVGKSYNECGFVVEGTETPALGHNMVDGQCDRCGYTSEYTVVITGALTASGRIDTEILSASTTTARAAEIAGVSGMGIHDGHTGTGYSVTSKTYDDATHKLSLTVAVDEHKMVYIGLNADKTKHVLKCSVDGCSATSEAEHSYNTTTGVCTCGETDASHKFNYSIAIKTTGGLQLAESKTVALTEAAAEAVKTNAKKAIEDYFPTIYADLTISSLNSATATVNHSTRNILLVVNKQESTGAAANEILVIYDDGNTRTINRDINVGTWYFSSSNLGLSNTWGTKQAILKIEDANGFRYVTWGSKDSDAYIKQTDSTVWVLGNNKTVTIYYLKSSTANPTTSNAHATRKYEFNTQLGTLPDLPAGYSAWYVDGVQLSENTVYDWESDYVYAYPGKGDGDGRVHLFIYNNNKELMKNVDVTDNVQSNGLITRDGLVKTIEYQTGRKNLTLAGLFTESGWAYYLNNNKSTRYAQTSISVGAAGERQGTQNIYVVLTNVSGGSNADSSNPKTGDNAMLGTAAIVMALAVVGMGTVFFMKKREKI